MYIQKWCLVAAAGTKLMGQQCKDCKNYTGKGTEQNGLTGDPTKEELSRGKQKNGQTIEKQTASEWQGKRRQTRDGRSRGMCKHEPLMGRWFENMICVN